MNKGEFEALKQHIYQLSPGELSELQILIQSTLDKRSTPNLSEEELQFIFDLFQKKQSTR